MMTLAPDYEHDLIAWANEQARLLRCGQFAVLDIEHLAEEIVAVGRSEQRKRVNRLDAAAEFLSEVITDQGTVTTDRLAELLHVTKVELALATGLSRDAVS